MGRAMDINSLDFTPYYYAIGTGSLVLSKDEHDFIKSVLGEEAWHAPTKSLAYKYLNQLDRYIDRFNTHMPGPIRIALLKDIVSEHVSTD